MANDISRSEGSNPNYSASLIQLQLLEALLESENTTTYPWNVIDPDSEAYFAEREQDFRLADWSQEETAESAQAFLTQLDILWSRTTPSAVSSLQDSLQQRFAACVPQGWLSAIARQAQQVFSNQRVMADQLVECVQAVLPSWAEEDLLVFVRPYAYAMRSKEPEVDSLLSDLRPEDWTALSQIEQAKLSVVIAHYALTELKNDPE